MCLALPMVIDPLLTRVAQEYYRDIMIAVMSVTDGHYLIVAQCVGFGYVCEAQVTGNKTQALIHATRVIAQTIRDDGTSNT